MRLLLVLLLLCAGPAFGAIATIPVEAGGTTATGTSGGIATSNFNVSAGDTVILFLRMGTDTSTTAVLSAPCSNESLTKIGASNDGVTAVAFFIKVNSGGGTACGGVVSFSGSTTYRANVYLVRGALTASPFDPNPLTNAVAGTFASSTSATTSTFTQAFTDELVLCFVSTDGSPATIAPGGSEVEAFAEYNNRMQVEYLSSATAGSKTCSWTFSAATAGNYWMFGVKSSSSSAVTSPSLSSVSKSANSTAGNTYSYTPSLGGASSVTVTLGVYKAGQGCPSAANVVAGTGTGYVAKFTKSSTAADTITSTGLDFPEHDYCLVATNTAANSSVSSDANVFKDPPTGYSYQVLTSVDSPSWYASITSPSAAAGDVGEITDPTFLLAQDVDLLADGNFSFSNAGARDLLCVRVYDLSAQGWMSVSPTSSTCDNSPTDRAAIWFNNQPPLCPVEDSVAFFFPIGTAITPIDLSFYHSDLEGDTLITSGLNLHGLSIVSEILQGTISGAGVYTDPAFTVTDIAGDTCTW